MIKFTQKNQTISFLVKILLFFGVIWLFYNQIIKIDWSEIDEIQIQKPLFLIATILLVFVNWFFEYLKWDEVLKVSESNVSLKIRIKSFLAGIVTGFLTPNMLGNFIGRMFYFQRRERVPIILLTLFSNAAQFIASITFGFIALIWLGTPKIIAFENSDFYLAILAPILVLLIWAFMRFEKIKVGFITRMKIYQKSIPLLQHAKAFRFKLMIFSLLRHGVFSLQYWLLLKAFGLEISWEWFGWIWQVFFWSTLIPSLWFGKLFIRESMALLILAPLTNEPSIILFASLILWVINQIVPALVGIPFITKKQPTA